jgi:XRE family transcriptional regulator, regulator of sulfur utilization
MKVGEIIKLIRTKRRISQKKMAEQFGISQNYLSLIETDKKRPSIETINIFAEKLGISKEALLFVTSDIPSELEEDSKKDFKKLQDNILYLILFDSNRGINCLPPIQNTI